MCMGHLPIHGIWQDDEDSGIAPGPWTSNDYVAFDLDTPWSDDERHEFVTKAHLVESFAELCKVFPDHSPEDVEMMTVICFGDEYYAYLKSGDNKTQ